MPALAAAVELLGVLRFRQFIRKRMNWTASGWQGFGDRSWKL